jgi:hypothetical protein
MTPISVRTEADGRVVLAMPTWPARTAISGALVRTADPEMLSLRYPLLTLRLSNAHAVYRVETCDRDVWAASLVEGWVSPGEVATP